jgi:hypothetical protein
MTIEFPTTVGACIDALYEARAKRLDYQREVDAMGEVERAYEAHILNTFDKTELRGAKGSIASASIKNTIVYQISDWDKFTAFVAETGAWELMRKQPGSRACAERFDAGNEVPGIEAFHKIGLSLTKASV